MTGEKLINEDDVFFTDLTAGAAAIADSKRERLETLEKAIKSLKDAVERTRLERSDHLRDGFLDLVSFNTGKLVGLMTALVFLGVENEDAKVVS